VPKAETLVKKVAEVDLDLEFATTDEEKQSLEESKAGKSWRLLRITAKTRLNLFEKLEDSGNFNILVEEQLEAQELKSDEVQEPEALNAGANSANANDGAEINPRPESDPTSVEV
jgi:THO complex subunit 1